MSGAPSLLTTRQHEELRQAILDYLQNNSFSESAQVFSKESGVAVPKDDGDNTDGVKSSKLAVSGLLEKKWTSVIRLQKKIMDLESKVAQLTEELSNPQSRKASSSTDWLPRPPAKYSLLGHRSPITRLAFHPSYHLIVSASEDTCCKIWDYEVGEFERTLKGHTKAVMDVKWDRKGDLLATCSADLTIKLWDIRNDYQCIKTLHGHDHSVSSICFLPTGDFLVSASRDKTIKIWEVSSGYCTKTLSGHNDWVRGVVCDEQGKLLASCSSDQSIRIWDIATGECKMELRGHDHVVEVVAFVPTNAYDAIKEFLGIPTDNKNASSNNVGVVPTQYVLSGSRDKSIKLWDISTGTVVHSFVGHDNWIRDLSFHPNGKYFFSVSDDKSLRVWEWKSARCLKVFEEAHGHFVTAVVCSGWSEFGASDGSASGSTGRANVVVTGGVDCLVKVWECR